MRYMHQKIYFNKLELQELEKHNPTLFDLAQYVADKAHITARVIGEDFVNVSAGDGMRLLCPSEVFHIKGVDYESGDPKCCELRCWSVYDDPSENPDKPYRPCWFRHWNEFVSDMKGV